MAKAFSILHRAAALLVAVCLLVGMALPVYAAGDGALFFDADSETIPCEPSPTVAETAQDPAAAGLESVSPKVDTVSETDGTFPAGNGSTPPSDTQDQQEETVLTKDAPSTNEEPTAEEEPLMLADDFSVSDGAGEPATIADTGASQGFIPATTTIYFAVDNQKFQDSYRVHLYAHTLDNSDLHKDMVDTGKTTTTDGRKIYSVTLNQADYSAGGFDRLIFQYFDDSEPDQNNRFKGQFFAFGGEDRDGDGFKKETAIDKIAGQMFDGGYSFEPGKNGNQGNAFNAGQWTRVEYYYKDMPLYFKNGSGTALEGVTAVFYKQDEKGGTEQTASQTIGTVGANQFYVQKILIPNNDSQFVKFTWGDNGESALYNFSTEDYTNTEKFSLTTANCFVYNDSASSWQSAGNDLLKAGKTIYFDATLSSYSYANDPDIHQRAMPGDGESMYCFLTGSDGSTVETVAMNKVTDSATPDRQLWYYTIPEGCSYTAVQFSATDNKDATAKDNKTKPYSTADIPPTLKDPCFFVDDGDPSAYEPNGTPVFRDGYWGEKDSRHDAESGKGSTVVDIDNSGTFTQQKGTKYITSTLYDYYTDYELNGLNRDNAPIIGNSSQRLFVTFEQFDRALSSVYAKNNNVKYPLYTGHFQPSINGWGNFFADVAGGMELSGWGNPNGTNDEKALYNTFMAVNNSALDDNGGMQTNVYNRTFQGLVEKTTSTDGLPLLRTKNSNTSNALIDPHFDEAFLQGKNSFNTVLGKVYKDVSFPFTKGAVFKDSSKTDDPEANAKYWYYDSSKASLYLKQDKTDGKYYLESPKDGDNNPTTDDRSKNINVPNNITNTHGFFPFNQTVNTVGSSQYNYGFGAKLQFDFTLTDDGQVVAGNDSNTKVPIKFFFSGDDDVWVYIDGKLVLDVGGAHGAASGLLEFGAGSTVTPYVSSNKNTTPQDGTIVYKTDTGTPKTVYFNDKLITFKNKGNPITLNATRTTHTLTMFYMERGMWESNMAVAFNFPDHNELQVEKQVDLSNVNDDFKDFFQGQNLFTFALKNLATHYGTTSITNTTPKPVEVGSAFTASSSATEHTTMEKGKAPSDTGSQAYKDQTVKWYVQGYDKNSQHRDLRYGTMELTSTLDISTTPDYLFFDVYAVENEGDGVLSTNYLYLTLVDSSGKQMGCDANGITSYLNTMLSGSVVMENEKWVTVKLQLNKMPRDTDFDLTKLSKIRIGDDYERTVYFRNFVFTAKPVVNTTVGFSVEQKDIPDYGSVNSKILMPADGAIFTSSVASNGTQAVDTDGTFDLQSGETVTFTDQFRRGSYISLQEAENPALYDTRWEVYENGTLVNTANTSSSVSGTTSTPLQGNNTKPEDGRIEAADTPSTGSSYTGSKPDANTLVFRSYAAPEEEFPKLKVKFINTVKVGTLVIKKEQPSGEAALTDSYHFTVTFSNVGGIGLGGADGKKMTKDLAVGDSWTITGIPIGTRFRVVETPADGSSLQDVTCNAADAKYDVDNGVRGTVTSETEQVTATFTNTAHQLMDIEVEKKWLDANDTPLTNNLPDAIWVKLERRAGTDDTWQDATSAVELKYDYMSKTWTHTFKRLDKTDVNGTGTPEYVYRVAECATQNGDYKANGTVQLGTYTYSASQTTDTTGKITLINKRTDPKFALNLTKMGIDGTDTPLLGGVEFKLEKLKADNTAETTYNGTTGSDGTDKGKCSFAPLSPGKYRLTETKTAEGYTLLSEAIEFTLTADGKCQRNSTDYGAVSKDTSGVYNIALMIYNRKGFTLPHTGADAPSLWLLLGLPALAAVLLVLVFRYKRGNRRS